MVIALRSLTAAAGLALGLLAAAPATAASCAASGLGFTGPTVDANGSYETDGPACYDFTATVVQGGPFTGVTGTGYFTFDAGILPDAGSALGDGNLFADPSGLPGFDDFPNLFPQYDFALDILGQTFVDEDSPLAILEVDAYEPLTWAALFEGSVIDNPLILGMESVIIAGQRRNLFRTDTPGVFEVDLRLQVIPLPAGVWLLLGGLAGLGLLARRRRAA